MDDPVALPAAPLVRPRRVMVDARLGLGSGIGRYVQNIVPRVAARLSDVSFYLVVEPGEAARAADFVAGSLGNVIVQPNATRPFSLREQISFPALAGRVDATWFVNYWMPLRWRGRALTIVHDLLHLTPNLFAASRAKRALARATFAKVRRDAEEIIFISRFTEREFNDHVGPAAGRTSVVHHGIDHNGAEQIAPSGPKQCQMIVVAAAKQHKNFEAVMEAWRRSALPSPWKLIIVTPGDALRSSLGSDALASADASVEVHRGVSDAELWRLYQQSAVLLMPSRYEGFGLPLLEGMAQGCVPISSTADALVEVGTGGCVSYVPPLDVEGWVAAMRTIAERTASDPEWVERAGARNVAHARNWRWDDAADRTAMVLDRLLAQPARPDDQSARQDGARR